MNEPEPRHGRARSHRRDQARRPDRRGRKGVAAVDMTEEPLAPASASRAARRPAGAHQRDARVVLLASLHVSLLAASSAPTPLLRRLQQQGGFSPSPPRSCTGSTTSPLSPRCGPLGLFDYAGRSPCWWRPGRQGSLDGGCSANRGGVGDLMIDRVSRGCPPAGCSAAIGAAMLDMRHQARGTRPTPSSPAWGAGQRRAAVGHARAVPARARLHWFYMVAFIGVIAVQARGRAAAGDRDTSRVRPPRWYPEVRAPVGPQAPDGRHARRCSRLALARPVRRARPDLVAS